MAMRRSRGVRSFTTLPPIRISPAVGDSRPAIILKSVVFPEPEGPRKTRNSPSRVSRSTSLTAPSSPCLNTLVSFRVSTTAIQFPRLFESLKDSSVLGIRRFCCILGRYLSLRHCGKHGWNRVALKCLIDGSRCISGIAYVGRPIQHIAQHLVLVGRCRTRVFRNFLLKIWYGRWEAGEIIELTRYEPVMESVNVVDQELLRAIFVLCKLPDHIAVHYVLSGNAAHRAFQCPAEHDVFI